MGLLVCSFVFLPFSEPARVLNSPVSPSGTAPPRGSEFACLPRKVRQPAAAVNTAEASLCAELLSAKVPRVAATREGHTGACQPGAQLLQGRQLHRPFPGHQPRGTVWGTGTSAARRAASPTWRAGGQTTSSGPRTMKPSTTSCINACFSHVSLGYQHLVCTF